MATWLQTIQEELDKIGPDDFIEPRPKIGPEDTPLGVADDELKKLFTLGQQLRKSASRALVDVQYAKNENESERLAIEYNKLLEKGKLITDIFWISLKDAFGLWGEPSIGIRNGWQVVRSEMPQAPSLAEVAGMLAEEPPDPDENDGNNDLN